jgi:hypothetical protein
MVCDRLLAIRPVARQGSDRLRRAHHRIGAHVRQAAPCGASNANRNPFHQGSWIFAQNGPSPHLPQSAFTPVRIYPSPHFLMVPDRRIPETVPPLRNHIKSANDSEHMHYALLSLWLRGVPHTLLSRLAVAGQQWFRKGRSARLFRIMHRCLVTSRCRCRRSCAGAT